MANPVQATSGVVIKVTINENSVPVNISSATTKNFNLKPPVGTLKELAASFFTDGTDGILTYTTDTATFDESGDWKLQVALSMTAFSGLSEAYDFVVEEAI